MIWLCLALCGMQADEAPMRAPLLPEGTVVSQATGVLSPAKSGGGLILRLTGDDAPADGRLREFHVLPSRVLERLESVHASSPNDPVEVTGALTVFAGRNWLLPVHVEREEALATRDVPTEVPEIPEGPTDAGDDESVADIVADLESAVSTLRRGIRERPDDEMSADVADDLVLVSRRGRISRDKAGAWILLLDADSHHGAEDRLILLPSKVLNELVRKTRQTGPGQPMLISGTVQHYRGRRFLLPSGWRVPRERENLSR